ncbi:MAG: MBL fold metallo-hydrolase [Pseudomonadota bacterium]
MHIEFLGGAGTVTGSKYLIAFSGKRLLVDCGLFQGFKALRERNWRGIGIEPRTVDAVILSHAHLDHSGYLPLFRRKGFKGPVISTEATRALCGILLPDSGYLMERDAEYANRKGFSRHHPALPLYTQAEAEAALKAFEPAPFGVEKDLGSGVTLQLLPAGHILGAAIIVLRQGKRSVVFSGDLGRMASATMLDPTPVAKADYLIVESTYGNRDHDPADPEAVLEGIIRRTAARGGTVVIPSFAVGRAQTLLYHLANLKEAGRIPDLPIYLDSPMAIDASDIFCRHAAEHRLSKSQCHRACAVARYVNRPEESKALDVNAMPKVIISASGMATGGRVLHHLKYFAPDPRNTLLFAGFQAAGTRGARLVGGEKEVKIHGEMVPIRAEVANLSMLSAHADRGELVQWLGHFRAPPRATFITHGEEEASHALAQTVGAQLGWHCIVPDHGARYELK